MDRWKWNDERDCDEFLKERATVADLLKYLDLHVSDSYEGKGDTMSSHNVPFTVSLYDEEGNYFTLVGAEIARFGGCGCESGINLYIKKD